MKETFYITTPLYYVNNEPHIGHAYTTILADVLKRYHQRFGREVHFLTGLDEHGQKVFDAATAEGIDPRAYCDRMATIWRNIWSKLGIDNDDFIRTTEPRHERIVIDVLNKLQDQGDIYEKEYEGWYSVFEERFFTEKDLVDGMDPIGGRQVEKLKERNYFFRMSNYQDWLIDYYQSHPQALTPAFRMNEVLGFLKQPLHDLCISRPKKRLPWGIPIPWDSEYVIYVWFDALLNYYSATVTPPAGSSVKWPADLHLIAKDILTTHAVYWPIMLHASGLEPPRRILAHGYWMAKDDAKMSKSIGNVVHPLAMAKLLGRDAFRYVLMREMTLGSDASFNVESFITRINADLANDLGNLYSRLAKVWQTGGYGATLAPEEAPPEIPEDLIQKRQNLAAVVREEVESFRLHNAIQEIMNVVRGLNQLVEQLKPWKIVKTDPESIRDALAWSLAALYEVAIQLEPVMPHDMSRLRSWIKPQDDHIDPVVGKHLVQRISLKELSKQTESAIKAKPPASVVENVLDMVTIDDFSKLDLRVGKILSAEPIPKADRLLKIKVDTGMGERQIVAGIAEAYSPESLTGKKVIVIVNLKEVKLRGVLSQGMLLAAGKGKALSLATLDRDLEPGVKIR